MRISQLAERSGVPVPTIKYYLREGLLPPGEATAATQAVYGQEHLDRIALVRALLGPGGLSVARAREVLAVVDDDRLTVLEALDAGTADLPGSADGLGEVDTASARACLERWGWQVDPGCGAVRHLAVALDALVAAGFEADPARLDRYADAARVLGEADVAEVPTSSRGDAVRYAVIGTILMEPVLVALRRLAQMDASVRRFGAS